MTKLSRRAALGQGISGVLIALITGGSIARAQSTLQFEYDELGRLKKVSSHDWNWNLGDN